MGHGMVQTGVVILRLRSSIHRCASCERGDVIPSSLSFCTLAGIATINGFLSIDFSCTVNCRVNAAHLGSKVSDSASNTAIDIRNQKHWPDDITTAHLNQCNASHSVEYSRTTTNITRLKMTRSLENKDGSFLPSGITEWHVMPRFCMTRGLRSTRTTTRKLDCKRPTSTETTLSLHQPPRLNQSTTRLKHRHPIPPGRYGGQNRKQSRLLRQAQGLVGGVQQHLHRDCRQCLVAADARDPSVDARLRCRPDGQEHYGTRKSRQAIHVKR